jgi:hypothetical protein
VLSKIKDLSATLFEELASVYSTESRCWMLLRQTPLCYVIEKSYTEVVRMLLNNGANVANKSEGEIDPDNHGDALLHVRRKYGRRC